jgi:hypothetical protein
MFDVARFGSGLCTPLDPIATIRPQPASSIAGSSVRVTVI